MNQSTSSSPQDAFRVSLEKQMRSLTRGRGVYALADQVMVSGLNFLTGIILVRGLGLDNFGKYAVAYSILLYANSLQLSFVSAPMLSLAPLQAPERRETFLEGMYALQVFSSIFLCIVFLALGMFVHIFTPFFDTFSIVAFACCVGTYQLQDWLRRYYFLRRRVISAIVTDAISYVGQLVGLLLLWKFHMLTLGAALLVIGITSLLAFLMAPLYDRLKLHWLYVRMAWQESKSLGRDLLITNQVRWLGVQGVLLIGTSVVGASSIGGLRATQNMTGPLNLALLSAENVIPARLAEAIYERGTHAAYRMIRKITLILLLCSSFMLPIVVYGKPILRFLYGPDVLPFYGAMLVQMGNMLLSAVARIFFYFFRSVRETRAMLIANLTAASISIGLIFPLGKALGAMGVVLTSTSGQIATIVALIFYWRAHRDRILSAGALKTADVGSDE